MVKDRHDKDLIDKHIRLTKPIYEIAKQNAEKANLNFNKYLYVLIAKGNVNVHFKYTDDEAEKIHRDLTYLHRNVNQLNIELNKLLKKDDSLLLDLNDKQEILDKMEELKKVSAEVIEKYDYKKKRTEWSK